MTRPPQVNAVLTKIAGGSGFSEDYDRAAVTPTSKWSGTEDVYVQEKLVSVFTGTTLNRLEAVTLYMDSDLATSVGLHMGDSLTYTYRGQSFTAKAQTITAPVLASSPNYTKIALEQINVA